MLSKIFENRLTYNYQVVDSNLRNDSLKLQFSLWSFILIILILVCLLLFKNI